PTWPGRRYPAPGESPAPAAFARSQAHLSARFDPLTVDPRRAVDRAYSTISRPIAFFVCLGAVERLASSRRARVRVEQARFATRNSRGGVGGTGQRRPNRTCGP